MKKYILPSVVFLFAMLKFAQAQTFTQLPALKDYPFTVYYSSGYEQRAGAISQQVNKALTYYDSLLSFKPGLSLFVLDSIDWKKYSSPGAVYGMPHYKNDNTLIVAASDNPFWKSFLPPLESLPKELAEQVRSVYKNASGLSMQPFFDLLALHELGHAFHLQGGLKMQRAWMGELFSNVFLHTYIAENDPGLLPALTIFPRMVVAAGAGGFKYTSLQDMDMRYDEIAQKFPRNYGWYQCRLHMGAASIYESGGREAFLKLWNGLKQQQKKVGDAELPALLQKIDPTLASLVQNWDNNTKK